MNLIPSSIAISNFLSLVCRLISCDDQQRYPSPVTVDTRGSRDYFANELDLESSHNLVDSVNNRHVPEVNTNAGRVRGYYMTIIRGKQIIAFEGIKYAESPSGRLRFKAPVPKARWSQTIIANNPGPPCLQLHYGRLFGEEDCLVVNVYTKNLNPVKPYPVIIFIHGGFWLSGFGAEYGPAYLLESDVILVTFNYRLGVLGYFSTGDSTASGNWGLKDQAAAIEWVHSNIKKFGGDHRRITLSGHSAGSVSTHLHMISNYGTRAMINNAISMSGTAYNVWGMNQLNTSRMVSMELANVAGCPSNQSPEMVVNCLRRIDASVLVANQLMIFHAGFFLPSIEPPVEGAFLTRTPDQAYNTGMVAKIPWIVTMTSRELNLPIPAFQANVIVSFLRAAFNTELPSLLSFRRKGVDDDTVRDRIIKYYSKWGSSSNDLSQQEFSQIATDRYFTVAIHKAIQMHSQVAPTYASVFNYSSSLGRAGRRGFQNFAEFGIMHGDDLVYFLNSTRNHPPIRRFDSHFAITKLLVNLYSNFAQSGEPSYLSEEDAQQYKIWDAVSNQEKLRFLRIDEEVKMIDDPYVKISEFWESLGIPDTTSFFRL